MSLWKTLLPAALTALLGPGASLARRLQVPAHRSSPATPRADIASGHVEGEICANSPFQPSLNKTPV